MGTTKKRVLRGGNVYFNGTSTYGEAEEIVLPEIKFSKAEFKALGLAGVKKIFTGFEAMESSIKWKIPTNEVAIACANPFKSIMLMIRGSVDVYGTDLEEEMPIIYYVRVSPSNSLGGNFKSKEDLNTETKFDVDYVKYEVNGQEIVELDVDKNIYRVGGEDLFAKYRENTGL
jgi:P2 family phage contractile tail tube protein